MQRARSERPLGVLRVVQNGAKNAGVWGALVERNGAQVASRLAAASKELLVPKSIAYISGTNVLDKSFLTETDRA